MVTTSLNLENGKGNVKKECIERARESLPYAGYSHFTTDDE